MNRQRTFDKTSQRPPVRELSRAATGKDLNIKGKNYYCIDGSAIIKVTEVIHTDSEHYKDPLVFNPERFLHKNDSEESTGTTGTRHPFGFIPFSAGARNCIGQKFAMMEMKIILSLLLFNFEMVPLMETKKVTVGADLVAAPYTTLEVKIKAR